MSMISANLPFEGFYESILVETLHEECEEFGGIINRQTLSSIAVDYASAYLSRIGHEYPKLALPDAQINDIAKKALLTSPREYNHETDVIQIEAQNGWMQQAFMLCDKQALAELFERDFAHRSGFHSFYSPKLADYAADVAEWNNPHAVGLVLECLCNPASSWDLLEDSICNGAMTRWLNP